jgi:hypothetical protein
MKAYEDRGDGGAASVEKDVKRLGIDAGVGIRMLEVRCASVDHSRRRTFGVAEAVLSQATANAGPVFVRHMVWEVSCARRLWGTSFPVEGCCREGWTEEP